MERAPQDKPHRQPTLKLKIRDFEDIYLHTKKLPKYLAEDLRLLFKADPFYSELYTKLNAFLFDQKQHRLEDTAKISHQVIDNLLQQSIPDQFLSAYLHILIKNRHRIQQFLNHRGADQLFKFVPASLTIDYLELYDINLSEKQKTNLINELTNNKTTLTEKLSRLPILFRNKQKRAQYEDLLIQNLLNKRRYDIAAKIIKKLHISPQKYPQIKLKLIENAAHSIHKWEKEKFCWEMLEEVYGRFPTAVAASIKSIMLSKVNAKMVEGLASICKRIPQVTKYLPYPINQKLKKIEKVLPNKLRNNLWQPSNKKQHFSLIDFGYQQKSVIWVDRHNIDQCLEQMCKATIIGIDTQSTVARTTLDTNYNLLATVQIATKDKVYVYDAKDLKTIKTNSKIAQQFFANPQVFIIGHTLDADLNGDVTTLFGVVDKVLCKRIDIVPIFKKYYPNKRAGLTFISQEVLGKPICKEYTLTDWDRRPLFRNQLHYAALDAVIVLKIWEIIKQRHPLTEAELNGEKPKKQPKPQKVKQDKKQKQDSPLLEEDTKEQEQTLLRVPEQYDLQQEQNEKQQNLQNTNQIPNEQEPISDKLEHANNLPERQQELKNE